MKRPYISIFAATVLILSLGSCNSSTKDSESDSKKFSKQDWTATELAGQYSFEENGDTIRLDLKNQNDTLVGPLNYNFEEKDLNTGIFRGVVKDSLLVGQYNFMSEGVNSIRETVFGIVPEGLIEGFGEIEDKDTIIVFRNIDSLRFDHGMILHKK